MRSKVLATTKGNTMAKRKPNARDQNARIMTALRDHFRGESWIYLEELRAGAGFGIDAQRRFDAWAIATAPSKGNERIAFEVKVSRGDFKRDLRKPLKQRPARLSSNRFFYVAPEGIIAPDDLPVWAGLWELF